MKIFRTTCYHIADDQKVAWVRYTTRRVTWAAAKNVTWGGKSRRVTLESADIPDDAWVTER